MLRFLIRSKLLIFVLAGTVFCFIFSKNLEAKSFSANDSNNTHYTLIINQVRGSECCDVGNLVHFQEQITNAQNLNLPANFSLRFDVLGDPLYQEIITPLINSEMVSFGALLEVTPNLAAAAGVAYDGDETNWYHANHAFLIGYSPEDRQKIIDTYFQVFLEAFGQYPNFSTAWMIDSTSLQHLQSEYNIKLHQITREQFGTDSYTLYGGPPHYPYYPSQNWVLVPDKEQVLNAPLIVRQTITDPVYNYGDRSNSFTSQPNDYALRQDTIDYFNHLFQQAHNQPQPYTFALIGLENSMPTESQAEYLRQLQIVSQWQQQNPQNLVLKAADFAQIYQEKQYQNLPVTIYQGQDQYNSEEKAWWITTDRYRARLRLSKETLTLTDLRIYDTSFNDPYRDKVADNLGWWIVPFVLDSSRFYQNAPYDYSYVRNDSLLNRQKKTQPDSLVLTQKLKSDSMIEFDFSEDEQQFAFKVDGQEIITFSTMSFSSPALTEPKKFDSEFYNVDQSVQLKWLDPQDKTQFSWGFNFEEDSKKLVAFSNSNTLESARNLQPFLLFPEITSDAVSSLNSELIPSNAYAMANRNPTRFILYLRNQNHQPALMEELPEITTTNPDQIKIKISDQDQQNGSIYIDLFSEQPLKTKLTVKVGDFSKTLPAIFAPNCGSEPFYCLKHPIQSWWWLRNKMGDWARN